VKGVVDLSTSDTTGDRMDIERALIHEPISSLTLKAPITVPLDGTLADAVRVLQRDHVGCVLVVDGNGGLAGLFTERDLLTRVAGKRRDWDQEPISVFMTSAPETLRPEDPIAWALNYMHLGGYRHVPLLDEVGHLVGVVSVKDIVEHIVELFPSAVLNLPAKPPRAPLSLEDLGGDD
jgi:CBS domain-containing protein